jgi:hypothetical protein
MAVQPPGAQVSEDGHYWWDESAQQWQPVAGDQRQASGDTQASGAAQASGDTSGSGQADTQVAGQCLEVDLSDDEVKQILEAAGVSMDLA